MSKQDFLGNLRQMGEEILHNVKSAGESAVKAGVKAGGAAAKKSSSPRNMAELIQRAVIILLVLVCFISVIFASCAKTDDTPASDNTTTQSTDVSPAL